MGEAWRIRGGAGQPDTRTTPSCQNTVGMGGKGRGSAAPPSHVWTSPAPPTSLRSLPWAPREPLVMSTQPTTVPAGTGLSQGLREGLGMPSALHFLVLLGGRGWNRSGVASCFQMHVRPKGSSSRPRSCEPRPLLSRLLGGSWRWRGLARAAMQLPPSSPGEGSGSSSTPGPSQTPQLTHSDVQAT